MKSFTFIAVVFMLFIVPFSALLAQDDDGDGILNGDECIGGPPGCPDADLDGVPDYLEPNNVDTDGDGLFNHQDSDDDGDGIPTLDENTGILDIDGDGEPNYLDIDSDGDGLSDLDEGIADDDGDGTLNYRDDDDNDGPLGDLDFDGVPNGVETTIGSDPNNVDSDGDGVADGREIGDIVNPQDTDGDGDLNILDTDDDGDNILTSVEFIPLAGIVGFIVNLRGWDVTGYDHDNDGTPDYLDQNSDGDSRSDLDEGTIDDDEDGFPNYRDTDDGDGWDKDPDGDGLTNGQESQIGSDPNNPDTDGDGINDGTESNNCSPPRVEEIDPRTGAGKINCVLSADDDLDGIPTRDENSGNLDVDGDGVPNYLDFDTDGDGIPDKCEIWSLGRHSGNFLIDTDGDGIVNYRDASEALNLTNRYNDIADRDCDGVLDYLDSNDTDGPCFLAVVGSGGLGVGTGPVTFGNTDGDGNGLIDIFDPGFLHHPTRPAHRDIFPITGDGKIRCPESPFAPSPPRTPISARPSSPGSGIKPIGKSGGPIIPQPIATTGKKASKKVIDGSTILFGGRQLTLRYVQTPGLGDECEFKGKKVPCGQLAKNVLAQRLGNERVKCTNTQVTKKGKLTGDCFVGEVDLASWLVANGWAKVRRGAPKELVELQKGAKEANFGLWQFGKQKGGKKKTETTRKN